MPERSCSFLEMLQREDIVGKPSACPGAMKQLRELQIETLEDAVQRYNQPLQVVWLLCRMAGKPGWPQLQPLIRYCYAQASSVLHILQGPPRAEAEIALATVKAFIDSPRVDMVANSQMASTAAKALRDCGAPFADAPRAAYHAVLFATIAAGKLWWYTTYDSATSLQTLLYAAISDVQYYVPWARYYSIEGLGDPANGEPKSADWYLDAAVAELRHAFDLSRASW